MTNQKSKKLKPSPRLKLLVNESRKAGQRVEHLIFTLLRGLENTIPHNFDLVDENIGLEGLSSLIHFQRTQALEELFILGRSKEEFTRCVSCKELTFISETLEVEGYDLWDEGDYCIDCFKSLDRQVRNQWIEDHDSPFVIKGVNV